MSSEISLPIIENNLNVFIKLNNMEKLMFNSDFSAAIDYRYFQQIRRSVDWLTSPIPSSRDSAYKIIKITYESVKKYNDYYTNHFQFIISSLCNLKNKMNLIYPDYSELLSMISEFLHFFSNTNKSIEQIIKITNINKNKNIDENDINYLLENNEMVYELPTIKNSDNSISELPTINNSNDSISELPEIKNSNDHIPELSEINNSNYPISELLEIKNSNDCICELSEIKNSNDCISEVSQINYSNDFISELSSDNYSDIQSELPTLNNQIDIKSELPTINNPNNSVSESSINSQSDIKFSINNEGSIKRKLITNNLANTRFELLDDNLINYKSELGMNHLLCNNFNTANLQLAENIDIIIDQTNTNTKTILDYFNVEFINDKLNDLMKNISNQSNDKSKTCEKVTNVFQKSTSSISKESISDKSEEYLCKDNFFDQLYFFKRNFSDNFFKLFPCCQKNLVP